MAKKQINVRVDEDEYERIAERAAAAGMEVTDYVRQVVTDDANDARHRFLAAGAHFVDAWGDHFAERFGHPAPAKQDQAHGQAA
jgi:enamine deaminase RidA (YjgF/YER057c/UK114 family)